jgi:hypothetical protein
MYKTDDEIIAIFDGWEIDNSFPDKDHVYRKNGRLETKNTFKYKDSFDWMISAVTKIETLGFEVTIHSDATYIRKTWFRGNFPDIGKVDTKRTSCYYCILEFAKWYNNEGLRGNI